MLQDLWHAATGAIGAVTGGMAWPARAGNARRGAAMLATCTLLLVPVAARADAENSVVPPQLSAQDAATYRRIFALQDDAKWKDADKEIGNLQNRMLLGHVLYQRYLHPTAYRATYAELKSWLDQYNDQPDAQRVHELALKRRTAGSAAPKAPTRPMVDTSAMMARTATTAAFSAPKYPGPARSAANNAKVRSAVAYVKDQLRRGDLKGASENLAKGATITGLMDAVERDILATDIAAVYFYNSRPTEALRLAEEVAKRNRRWAPQADWIAGLAAWELGQYEKARGYFEIAAQSKGLEGRDRAGAAFWAARANLVTHKPQKVTEWLAFAAEESHSLYGVLAARQLGQSVAFEWETPGLDEAELKVLLATPAIRRAIALMQVGEDYLADREMRAIYDANGLKVGEPLLAIASEFKMAATELRIGRDLLTRTGLSYTGALYPVPVWDGFDVDPALVLALVRQESAFNTRAKSVDGAQGLMQLMPSTASFIASDRSLQKTQRDKLLEQDLNLALGQRYVLHLMEQGDIRGNLMLTVAAYNGGPGNLSKWTRAMGPLTDPLLFIEKIPVFETRDFAERVLANFWIYRARLGLTSPSLDDLAGGHWPIYENLETTRTVSINGRN